MAARAVEAGVVSVATLSRAATIKALGLMALLASSFQDLVA